MYVVLNKIFAGSILLLAFLLCMPSSAPAQSTPPSRKDRIRQSPYFHAGEFRNLEPTPAYTRDYSFLKLLYKFMFRRDPDIKPSVKIPSLKTDLRALSPDSNVLVWFGHSSYFMQVAGVKILVDPVLSGHASPVSFMVRSFTGTDTYAVADLPELDYLFITHDHYDHLDKGTVKALQPHVEQVVCGLGVGRYLEKWGYAANQLIEADWNETVPLKGGITLHTLPARHFSGRGLSKNKTLWMAYLLETPNGKFFLGGDSGYGSHFAQIGAQYGPIDLAILENGQYDEAWHFIHCLPEETLQAARDLKARNLMPVHNSKFSLALHGWRAPMEALTKLNESSPNPVHLVRPRIGEAVSLDDSTTQWPSWWEPAPAFPEAESTAQR